MTAMLPKVETVMSQSLLNQVNVSNVIALFTGNQAMKTSQSLLNQVNVSN